MSYIKIETGQLVKEHELRGLFPYISFPEIIEPEMLEKLGYAVLVIDEQPEAAWNEEIEALAPAFDGQTWRQSWQIKPLAADQQEALLQARKKLCTRHVDLDFGYWLARYKTPGMDEVYAHNQSDAALYLADSTQEPGPWLKIVMQRQNMTALETADFIMSEKEKLSALMLEAEAERQWAKALIEKATSPDECQIAFLEPEWDGKKAYWPDGAPWEQKP